MSEAKKPRAEYWIKDGGVISTISFPGGLHVLEAAPVLAEIAKLRKELKWQKEQRDSEVKHLIEEIVKVTNRQSVLDFLKRAYGPELNDYAEVKLKTPSALLGGLSPDDFVLKGHGTWNDVMGMERRCHGDM